MCFFSSPKISAPVFPPPPPPPEPPPPPPKQSDPKVTAARTKSRRRAALAIGRTANIHTSGLGLTTSASSSAKKSLTGT